MATSKSKVVDIVETMDGTMSVNHDSTTVPAAERIHEVELYTPAGLAWSATGSHTMILRYPGGPIDWDDVLAEVQQGTMPCDVGCEWDDDCERQRKPRLIERWMAALPKDPDERQAVYDTINRARRNK
jgi:hypothetical protein